MLACETTENRRIENSKSSKKKERKKKLTNQSVKAEGKKSAGKYNLSSCWCKSGETVKDNQISTANIHTARTHSPQFTYILEHTTSAHIHTRTQGGTHGAMCF